MSKIFRVRRESHRTRQLNDQGTVEDVLQPSGEHERNSVTHVHGAAGRTSTSIEIERLLLLVSVEDGVEVTVGKRERFEQPE
jgi:hypothetical protein